MQKIKINNDLANTRLDKAISILLTSTSRSKIQDYIDKNSDSIFMDELAFSEYMKDMFRIKGYTQQEVFLRADMPERYGYKIISMEKHTVQRDVIIRLCLASEFDKAETNRALKLYGLSELYSKVPRDAVIIVAINSKIRNIDEVNDLLKKNGFNELYSFALD